MTNSNRSEIIRSNLSVSKAYSPAASKIVDDFQEIFYEAGDLTPAEELRLLAEIQRQIAGRIVTLACQ